MNYVKLVINAALAGFWAGLAAFSATGELTKTALFAAGAIAIRAFIGAIAQAFGHPVTVDQ